jgi:predicted RNA-binding protein YlxR (DUF448 family)
MPNQNSKAAHLAQRTCIICREKSGQDNLYGFYLLGNEIVFDIKKTVSVRKSYVCQSDICISQINKWLSRYLKKR